MKNPIFTQKYKLKSMAVNEDFPALVVNSSLKCYEFLKPLYGDSVSIYESFYCLYFNSSNQLVGHVKIGQGGVAGCVADGKLVFKCALDLLATAIILSHNHPSGNLTPSDADINLTRKFRDFGNMIGVRVLDHIILTPNGYMSFADDGRI